MSELSADYVAPAQLSMAMPGTVQSVVQCRENGPLLATVATLWIGADELVVDATYGTQQRGRTCRYLERRAPRDGANRPGGMADPPRAKYSRTLAPASTSL